MAQDDVAFALVAAGGSLARSGEFHVTDERAKLSLGLLQAVNRFHLPSPLTAEERSAAGVASRGRLELAVNHHARPREHEVNVVGARDERRDLRAGRTRADLGDGDAPVRAPKPLHVAQPRVHPQGFERAEGDAAYVVVLRVVNLPRQNDAPLNPGVA